MSQPKNKRAVADASNAGESWWWELPARKAQVPLSTRISAVSLIVSLVGVLLALVPQIEQAVDVKLVYSGSVFSLGAVAIVALWYLPGPWSPAANPVLRAATILVVGLGLGAVLTAALARVGPFSPRVQPVTITSATPLPLAAGRPAELGPGQSLSISPDLETSGTTFTLRFVFTNRRSEPAEFQMDDSQLTVLSSAGDRYQPLRLRQAQRVSVPRYSDVAVPIVFAGAIPGAVTHLDVSVASFSNPPLQWRVPLVPANSPNLVISAFKPENRFQIFVVTTNYGDRQVVVRYRDSDLELTDDLGNRYELAFGDAPRMFVVPPGRTASDSTEFKGALDPKARRVQLRIRKMAGVDDVLLEVPVQ